MLGQQEKALWQAFHQESEQTDGLENSTGHKQRLFDFYRDWASSEAKRLFNQLNIQGGHFEEFNQWAYQGLLESIEKFNPEKGKSFKGFAVHRVRGTILSAIPNLSENASFYAERGRYLPKYQKLTASPQAMEEGEPVSSLVSMVMTMAIEYLLKEGDSELTQLTGEFYSSPEISTITSRIRDQVNGLEEPMKSIIKLYYFEEMSFDKAAKLLTLSNSRVSQLHSQAINTLKTRVGW